MAGPGAVNLNPSQLLIQIKNGQKELGVLERKVTETQASISSFSCDQQKMNDISVPGYFQRISSADFENLLTPLVKCFISDWTLYTDIFKQIFESGYAEGQLRAFADRLSRQILLKEDALQKKIISRLLSFITLNRLKSITAQAFPQLTFQKDLLNRVKADSLSFPFLTKNEAPQGIFQNFRSIWKICIEDIDNFLESYDILTQTPITGQDALSFCTTYQMSMTIVAAASDKLPPGIGAFLTCVPFIMNALRKLYMHYCTKTPSTLSPLMIFSDPNFYRCVAPITNRDQILHAISAAWSNQVTPLLVGKPGCGKTSILIEVARRIHQGTFPGIIGKDYQAFGGSATSLASAGGIFAGNSHIERILKKIAEKKEHTILLLDEIHTFNDSQKTLLRTYFDNSPNSVRYAVFATTTLGADEFFKGDDGSLARRFATISIPNLDIQETKFVLHHQALEMAPTLIIDPKVITRITTSTKGNFAESRKLLCQILRKALTQNTTCPSQTAYNLKLNELSLATVEHLRQLSVGINGRQVSAISMNQLEQERIVLEEKLKAEQLNIQTHAILLAKRSQLIFKTLDLSQKILAEFHKFLISKRENLNQIASATEENHFCSSEFQSKIEKSTKKFLYYNVFLNETLLKRIREFEEEYNFISEISDDYVKDDDLILPDADKANVA